MQTSFTVQELNSSLWDWHWRIIAACGMSDIEVSNPASVTSSVLVPLSTRRGVEACTWAKSADILNEGGGGDGEFVRVEWDTLPAITTASLLLRLDIDSDLWRFTAGGWAVKSKGEILAWFLDIFENLFDLFVKCGLDCVATWERCSCCFWSRTECIRVGEINCAACWRAMFKVGLELGDGLCAGFL